MRQHKVGFTKRKTALGSPLIAPESLDFRVVRGAPVNFQEEVVFSEI